MSTSTTIRLDDVNGKASLVLEINRDDEGKLNIKMEGEDLDGDYDLNIDISESDRRSLASMFGQLESFLIRS